MSDRRVVIEEPCEHGNAGMHDYRERLLFPGCTGGVRRVLEPGSYVLIEKDADGNWPRRALVELVWTNQGTYGVAPILDRLAGDTP